MEKSCHSDIEKRIKMRNDDEKKKIINRLSRIEGQIRGIKRMVEGDEYCTDILIQASAVNNALNAFSKELLSTHIKGCVVKDIKDGKEEVIDDLLNTLERMMK